MSPPHAIVTGGSSGIGLALASRLRDQGMSLTLIARREPLLQQARLALLSRPAAPECTVMAISADVAVRDQAEGAVVRAVAELGPASLVVTSAGIAQAGRFEQLPADSFERAMAVNYLGTVYVVRKALGSMQAGARIVMISSGAGLIGLFGYTAYSPTKFALRGFAESLHAELRHKGIGVSIAFPPDTDTPQLAEEARTRPQETRMMTAAAGLREADWVAAEILRGTARGAFAIAPGAALGLLYRAGGMLSPLLQHYWAWKVGRMRRSGMTLSAEEVER